MKIEGRTPYFAARDWSLTLVLLALALSVTEPLLHFWIQHFPPEGAAPTGFHIGDTPFFLTDMRMFRNGFESPYAACDLPLGSASVRYFALPHHWIYGCLGLVASFLGVSDFTALGFANAFCGFFYLIAVYAFLRVAVPLLANLAFLLFMLGGGLGGAAYLLSMLMGWTVQPAFDGWFFRFARYELIEGPFLSPLLMMPRLYYTLSLGLGFLSLTRLLEGSFAQERRGARLLLFLATLINARLGALFWVVGALYLWIHADLSRRERIWQSAAYAVPVALATALVWTMFQSNPAAAENVNELLRRCAWFGSLITLLFWRLFLLPSGVAQGGAQLPRWGRAVLYACLGYLVVFAAFYVSHQIYYGNWSGGDTAAAMRISDWALPGLLAACLARKRTYKLETGISQVGYFALWTMLLLSVSISAFGQGWFLGFMPERALALLGAPVAVLSAAGLKRLQGTRPKTALFLLGVILASGLCSIGVSLACFQGPLGQHPGAGPFHWTHSEIMLPEDARLMARIPQGTVLAPATLPPLFGDIIVHQHPGTRTVFGQGTLEYGGVNMQRVSEEVYVFFRQGTPGGVRRETAERYCAEYIYCPATHSLSEEVVAEFRALPWLREIDSEGAARLFQVVHAETN